MILTRRSTTTRLAACDRRDSSANYNRNITLYLYDRGYKIVGVTNERHDINLLNFSHCRNDMYATSTLKSDAIDG